MAESQKWAILNCLPLKKKRANSPLVDAPPFEKRRCPELFEGSPKTAAEKAIIVLQEEKTGTPAAVLLEEMPAAKVARVLARILESKEGPTNKEAAKVVNIFNSPVKASLKTRGRRELSIVRQRLAGEKLVPGKILLKDEDVERIFPKVGAPPERRLTKKPLVICGLAPLGKPSPLPIKTIKPSFSCFLPVGTQDGEKKEEKDRRKGGDKTEEGIKKKEGAPQVVLKAALGIEG
ncbi:hypothetical protein AXF42_Ash013517 [Apostasia shenzhenica]|uniref:Uncharacterized protein n=1 Tax=Apostasia shenzhenica TaxID=1088818 RepID=A0A2I0A4G4_9ASPA|nr:hypothetical protein AXF42_Ash013517 [Apostasia shenzhenica]